HVPQSAARTGCASREASSRGRSSTAGSFRRRLRSRRSSRPSPSRCARCRSLPSESWSRAPSRYRTPAALPAGIAWTSSWEFLEPDIFREQLAGRLHLNPNFAALVEHLRVFIDQYRNNPSVEQVRHFVADRDDVQLV